MKKDHLDPNNERISIKNFSSSEEADLCRLKIDIDRSDFEKFQMLCKMLRLGKMLSSVQVANKWVSSSTKDEELLMFWAVLNKHDVKYIMGGGWAVNVQGFSGAMSPPELWLKDHAENRKNLSEAFEELGYGDYPSLETLTLVPGWTQFYIAGGLILDIITEMKGLENQSFDECLQKARIADFNGVRVPFLHINDLIANKKAVFRPKDQIDLLELEKIKKIQDEADRQKNP